MRAIARICFLFLLCSSSFAGTKEEERPDREMLKLLELLREWEVIKNIDLMRQLDSLNRAEGADAEPRSQKSQQGKTKDWQK